MSLPAVRDVSAIRRDLATVSNPKSQGALLSARVALPHDVEPLLARLEAVGVLCDKMATAESVLLGSWARAIRAVLPRSLPPAAPEHAQTSAPRAPATLVEFLRQRIDRDEFDASGGFVHDDAYRGSFTDSSRVIVECAAKRKLIEYATDADGGYHLHAVCALLAEPYASHPDYREEYKP